MTRGTRGTAAARSNRARSYQRTALLVLALSGTVSGVVHAQDTSRIGAIDSLLARIERTEERIRFLEQQLAAEAQSAVRTRSRVALEFHGRVIVNAFSNSRRVNGTGNPGFVRPDDPGDPYPRGLAMQVRQTTLGFGIAVAEVMGGQFIGDVDVDFSGGQIPSSGGRTFPLLRIRTARALVQWKRGELLVGQESPLVADVSPVSLAAVGTPGFAAAGNLWLWLPQVRGTYEWGERVRVGVQGALLAPGTSAPVGSFEVSDFDAAERSSRPFVEARARLRWGADDLAGEIGVGRHDGWFQTADNDAVRASITAATFVLPVTRLIELRGEAYEGRGARALGGGAIGQLFGVNADVVRSRGGWVQLNLRWPTVVMGGGYGVDDPHDTDLAASGRLENAVVSAHAEWRFAGPLVLAGEFRRLRTAYLPRAFTNDHLNIAFGFEF